MDGLDAVESAGGQSRIGSVLADKWQLVKLVGRGLVGDVFEASDTSDGRVAICVLRSELFADSELSEGFVAAARDAAQILHADTVRVLADGMTGDQHPFVVTELLSGETIAKLIERRRGRVYPAEALRLVRDALDVLGAAHESGLVHGELTPERLFVTDNGTVKVLGFGIASLRQRAAKLLGLDAVPGTTAYLAPEQARDGTVNEQTDLFALGAVLFTLLTGQSVHEGDSDAEQRESASTRSARSLAGFAPAAPPGLLRLLDRALAAEPGQRFASARAMRTAVDHALMLPELLRLRSLREATPMSTPLSTEGRGSEPPLSHRRTLPAPPSVPGTPADAGRVSPIPRGHAPVRVAERAALRAGWRGGSADTLPAFAPVTAEAAPESEQRVAPDASYAEDLRALFAQLERALGARLAHGAEHAEAERELAALAQRTERLLARTRTALHWNVTERGFTSAGRSVWEPQGDLARVPARLFTDGVKLLAFLPGLEQSEIDSLLGILGFDPTAESREDDLVTLLWQAKLPHVMHHAVGPFSDEPARARFEQEKRHTLALVRFDTSLQLEDCWSEARGDTAPAEWRESLLLVLGRRRNDDGQTFVGGRAAMRMDPAEREATAARLAAEDHVTPARFAAVDDAASSSSGKGEDDS